MSSAKVTKQDIIKLVYKYNYFKPYNYSKVQMAMLLISDVGPASSMEDNDIELLKKVIPESTLRNTFHNYNMSLDTSYDVLFDRVLYKCWP